MKVAFMHMTMGLVTRGSEVSVDILATQLAKRHDVLVLQSGPKQSKNYKVKVVYPLTKAPSTAPRNILEKLLFKLKLDSETGHVVEFSRACITPLIEFNPDIIVVTNGSSSIKVLKHYKIKAKLVYFGRSGIGHHDLSALKARPDLYIALSSAGATWAKSVASLDTKVVYVPNPQVIHKAKKINIGLASPIVLVVGAMTKYKNITSVVEAARLAGTSLLVIGDGEDRTSVEQALSTYPHEFRWIKRVEQAEMVDYYASCDVFCFVPDPQEAFGRVYIEAMAAGLPIVASDDEIRQSIVGDQGLFVDPHNFDQIAEAITKASKMGKLDYKQELKPFELSTVVTQLEKEFHDLIK